MFNSNVWAADRTHPVRLWIIEEVGPVGIGLHVPELKKLSEAQKQDVLANLGRKQTHKHVAFSIGSLANRFSAYSRFFFLLVVRNKTILCTPLHHLTISQI